MTPEVTVRWLSFEEYGDEILQLRRRVFVEEQGFGEDMVRTPYDREGLHLGAIRDGKLVAVLSAYIHDNDAALLIDHRLPPTSERVVQFRKRVSLPDFRGNRVNALLGSMMLRGVYETLRPQSAFIVLRGMHSELQSSYAKQFGFIHHATIETAWGPQLIMTFPDEASLRANYLRARNVTEDAFLETGLLTPSLVRFLERTGRTHLLALDKLKRENLYVAPLSLKDELPRLSAQTRVLYREQKGRLAAAPFPKAPARLLDLGAGPGVYLSMLSRESKLRGYELVGLDEMAEMVTYARLNRPDLRWIKASAYDTGEPAESYDVVHANFLFLHLLNPAAVLREIHRILKPGGIFYVFEISDSTFQGPPAIADLIRSHCELYLGNRRIMNTLPRMAAEHGLELAQRFATTASNTGTENEPVIAGEEMRLNRMMSWGLYSFLGQREELSSQLRAAQEFYFNSSCEISISFETHVYRKS
jgi:ubiquinone/menaquinone biosynthesis C-methylase UbiE